MCCQKVVVTDGVAPTKKAEHTGPFSADTGDRTGYMVMAGEGRVASWWPNSRLSVLIRAPNCQTNCLIGMNATK